MGLVARLWKKQHKYICNCFQPGDCYIEGDVKKWLLINRPISLYARNDARRVCNYSLSNISEMVQDRHSYNEMPVGNHIQSVKWWHFQWPWGTLILISRYRYSSTSNNSKTVQDRLTRCSDKLGTLFLSSLSQSQNNQFKRNYIQNIQNVYRPWNLGKGYYNGKPVVSRNDLPIGSMTLNSLLPIFQDSANIDAEYLSNGTR